MKLDMLQQLYVRDVSDTKWNMKDARSKYAYEKLILIVLYHLLIIPSKLFSW